MSVLIGLVEQKGLLTLIFNVHFVSSRDIRIYSNCQKDNEINESASKTNY